MVGLTAERLNSINVEAKAMQLFGLYLSQFFARRTDHKLAHL